MIFLLKKMKECKVIIAAWGNDGKLFNRDWHVKAMFKDLKCLSITKNGCPGHPLYLKSDSKLKSLC